MIRELQITLQPRERTSAAQAMVDRGLLDHLTVELWYGPHFKENVAYKYDSHFLTVGVYATAMDRANGLKPVAEYMYPLSSIARLKIVP